MGTSQTFRGASGRSYEYGLTSGDNLRAISHQPGNFVFARSASGGSVVLYVGEAHSLNAAFQSEAGALWKIAVRDHGANILAASVRGASSPEERQREVADLAKKHRPPLNGPDTGDADRE